MSKKSISQKKLERQQQEELTLRHVLNAFLAGLAAECYLLLVYRGYVAGTAGQLVAWHTFLRVGTWVGLALFLAGLAAAVVKRGDVRVRNWLALASGVGFFLFLSGLVMTSVYPKGVTLMCVVVPVVTLLALVWFLFQRECFFSTMILSGALFTVWLCGNVVSIRTAVIVGAVAVLLGLAAAAWVVHLLQKGQGKLAGVQIMDTMCEYWLLYSVLGLSFVSIAVALLAVPAAYYLMWVLGVALFAEMVYYTTQLM